jgi:hypothetical protein
MSTREELVKVVADASDAYYAADARDDTKVAYDAAFVALIEFDKENTSTREELAKAVGDACAAYGAAVDAHMAADDAKDVAGVAYDAAFAALAAYDKENT